MSFIPRKDSTSARLVLRCMVTSALMTPLVLAGTTAAEASPASRQRAAHAAAVRAEAPLRAHVAKVRAQRLEAAQRRHVVQVRRERARVAILRARTIKARTASQLAVTATPSTPVATAAALPVVETAPSAAPVQTVASIIEASTPASPVAVAPTAAPVAPAPVAPAAAPVAPAPAAVSSTMPGASAGPWKRVFADDFTNDVPLGSFLSSEYKNRWMSYDGFGDTSGVGQYAPNKVLSVKDGALDMYLHTENGVPLGAAPVPLVNGQWPGQVYGKFSVRFRADSLKNFGNGWLLWPNSNNWDEGELDFAEGALDGTISAYGHCVGNPRNNCLVAETKERWNEWHTATVEWLPNAVTFLLDGKVIGVTKSVPTTKMHMVLQTATTGLKPAATTAGHVQIDWVTIDEYRP